MDKRLILLTLFSFLMLAMSAGIRNNYGLMLGSIIENTGLDFATTSFVLAVGQLVFGASLPIFGIMVARKGSVATLILGIALMLIGMLIFPFSNSLLVLLIFLGLVLPAGTGAVSYGIIIAAIMPKIPKKIAPLISGIVNAGHGMGNIILSPVISFLIASFGLLRSMLVLAVPTALMLPLAVYVGKSKSEKEQIAGNNMQDDFEKISVNSLFQSVVFNKTYILLMIGFFTCGFHMAIVLTHLATDLETIGFTTESVAFAFSIYGIASIVGSIASGAMCGKFEMKNVLAFFYGVRPLAIILFLLMPNTLASMFLFTALLGFSGVATVPPVAGIVGRVFGIKNIPLLYGFVFFVHQIGAFISAWAAGIHFSTTESYVLIWIINATLGVIAATASFLIDNRGLQRAESL